MPLILAKGEYALGPRFLAPALAPEEMGMRVQDSKKANDAGVSFVRS